MKKLYLLFFLAFIFKGVNAQPYTLRFLSSTPHGINDTIIVEVRTVWYNLTNIPVYTSQINVTTGRDSSDEAIYTINKLYCYSPIAMPALLDSLVIRDTVYFYPPHTMGNAKIVFNEASGNAPCTGTYNYQQRISKSFFINSTVAGIMSNAVQSSDFIIYKNENGDYTFSKTGNTEEIDNAQLLVYNITGQEVLNVNLDNNRMLTLNFHGLTNGIYICELRNKEKLLGVNKVWISN